MRQMTDWCRRTQLQALLRGLPDMGKVMLDVEDPVDVERVLRQPFQEPAARNITVDAQQEARSLQTVLASASCACDAPEGGGRGSTLRFRMLLTTVN